MIDSVQNIKAQGQNPFADYKTKGNYYLTLETAQDIFETQEKNKEKKHKRVGLIIASSAIAAALGIFALTKGLPKNTYRWLQNLSQRLEENVNRRKLNGESGPVTSFYNYSLKKVLSFADKAKSINNFSSFKDLFLARVMAKNKYSKSLWQKITDLFENLARNSVNKAYRSSDKQFGKLFENYAQINQKILDSGSGDFLGDLPLEVGHNVFGGVVIERYCFGLALPVVDTDREPLLQHEADKVCFCAVNLPGLDTLRVAQVFLVLRPGLFLPVRRRPLNRFFQTYHREVFGNFPGGGAANLSAVFVSAYTGAELVSYDFAVLLLGGNRRH